MTEKLTTVDHSRDAVGLKYVYPVLSRRAGGLSIGINFNTNNACNWRCIYCQVPDLVSGAAPDLDVRLLEIELTDFLDNVLHGDFFDRYDVGNGQRLIKDIAISGNGEPTSLKQFDTAVSVIGKIATQAGIMDAINFVLITNGSLIHHSRVKLGLKQLQRYNGQVWYKLDRATPEGRKEINHAAISQKNTIENLVTSAKLCPTWLQTCLFKMDGTGLTGTEKRAFLDLLLQIKKRTDLQGVMVYSIARASLQPEASRLSSCSADELHSFANDIQALGFEVKISI